MDAYRICPGSSAEFLLYKRLCFEGSVPNHMSTTRTRSRSRSPSSVAITAIDRVRLQKCTTRELIAIKSISTDILYEREAAGRAHQIRIEEAREVLFQRATYVWKHVDTSKTDAVYRVELPDPLSSVPVYPEVKRDRADNSDVVETFFNEELMRDCLRHALYKSGLCSTQWYCDKSPNDISFGDSVPCVSGDCWYSGNSDRVGEWSESLCYVLWPDVGPYCDVCIRNISLYDVCSEIDMMDIEELFWDYLCERGLEYLHGRFEQ